jgi:hypothetical protein
MFYARPNLPLSQFDLGDVGAAACIGNRGDSNASPSSYRREMASYRGYSSRIQRRIHMLVKRDFLASVTAEMTILIAITSVSLGIQS